MGRVWATLLVGLALAAGTTTFLLVVRPIDANWIEAAGTWFVGLVGVVALVVLAFWSKEAERRQEQERLQLEANNVFCDIRLVGTHAPADPQIVIVDQLEVEVINYSRRVISGIFCEVPLPGFDSPLLLREALGPGEPATQTHPVRSPFKEDKDNRHLVYAEFRFSLDGVAWSKRYGQPAHRCPKSDAAP